MEFSSLQSSCFPVYKSDCNSENQRRISLLNTRFPIWSMLSNVWLNERSTSVAESTTKTINSEDDVINGDKLYDPCEEGEFIGFKHNCREYQKCIAGVWKNETCFPDFFDQIGKECVENADVCGHQRITCQIGNHKLNPNDCGRFQLCVEPGVWRNRTCFGYNYDATLGLCVDDVRVCDGRPLIDAKPLKQINEPTCLIGMSTTIQSDCSKYQECIFPGIWDIQSCPNSKFYDPTIIACVTNPDVCGTRKITKDETCTIGEFDLDPLDCQNYKKCIAPGKWSVFSCKPDTFYHPRLLSCVADISICDQRLINSIPPNIAIPIPTTSSTIIVSSIPNNDPTPQIPIEVTPPDPMNPNSNPGITESIPKATTSVPKITTFMPTITTITTSLPNVTPSNTVSITTSENTPHTPTISISIPIITPKPIPNESTSIPKSTSPNPIITTSIPKVTTLNPTITTSIPEITTPNSKITTFIPEPIILNHTITTSTPKVTPSRNTTSPSSVKCELGNIVEVDTSCRKYKECVLPGKWKVWSCGAFYFNPKTRTCICNPSICGTRYYSAGRPNALPCYLEKPLNRV
jgi:hypothetical protein